MKRFILVIFLSSLFCSVYGQNNDTWTSFWNKDTTLFGFKDKNGVVRIEPKFTTFSYIFKFDNIIEVDEKIDDKIRSFYYLTKSGKIVGKDSIFMFDNSPDCENEGFIRFEDSKNDKVGIFNRFGNVVIPANYNYLSRVKNGLIVGLKDAVKKFDKNDNHVGCNHFSWTGGQKVLIDTLNNILIENIQNDYLLDFYSLEKTNTIHSDTIRNSYLAKNGQYFSFINYEKEFKQWIKNELVSGLTNERLLDISYDSIYFENSSVRLKVNKNNLINDNFLVIKNGLLEILQPKSNLFITNGDLNSYHHNGSEFEKYYNNCEEYKYWIYPVWSIILSHGKNKNFSQNVYEFLRTENGYKLISLQILNEKIKF